MFQPPICPECGGLVPPTKNPGAPRKYCSYKCYRRFNSKKAYMRERGHGEGITQHDGIPWFNRQLARNASTARRRLEEHNEDCPFSPTGDGTCPAWFDPYDRRRLCLIHAVLNEDWSQLMAAEESQPYTRLVTTTDGHWLTDKPEGGVSVRTTTLTDAEREDLIRIGAAKPT